MKKMAFDLDCEATKKFSIAALTKDKEDEKKTLEIMLNKYD